MNSGDNYLDIHQRYQSGLGREEPYGEFGSGHSSARSFD
jgi:hypothetical protein